MSLSRILPRHGKLFRITRSLYTFPSCSAIDPFGKRQRQRRKYNVSTNVRSSQQDTTLKDLLLFDSLSGTCKPVVSSSNEKGLAWYICGPTTYDSAHLGHARTYVCLDVVRRVLESTSTRGPPPLFVMNITNVDDKILEAARRTGEPPLELARRHEVDFWRDMDRLGCLRPHVVTRVTEHMDSILLYIERILKQGMAYIVEDDGVYFDVRTYEETMGCRTKYGKLAPPSAATDFFDLNDNRNDTNKRDARDFALWKNRKEGEELWWDSPWGEGRPGWHIECSAMIEAVQRCFGETHTIAVHSGGVDLRFPHHTNEIAQAEAFRGPIRDWNEWIPHWVHTGHLHIDGLKMSKSLKNFISIETLLHEDEDASPLSSPADDFRLWCLGLSGSYRGTATYSAESLQHATRVRQQIVRFLLDGEEWMRRTGDSGAKLWTEQDTVFFSDINEISHRCEQCLRNDLDGKSFLEGLIQIVDKGNDYMRTESTVSGHPPEVLHSALQSLRKLLSWVGFSSKTCQAGEASSDGVGSHSLLVGGERALLDQVVKFRASVRKAALSNIRSNSPCKEAKEILRLCDEAREVVLPSIGVQLEDSKSDGGDDADVPSWKYCAPPKALQLDSATSKVKTESPQPSQLDLSSVPLEDFFRVGQYRATFAEFTEDGFPLTLQDGTPVSKRLAKKLQKKLEKHKHKQRLD